MITRKSKLLGVSVLLLGAPSSISLSNMDLSRLSLDNLFSFSGGAKARSGDADYEVIQNMKVGDLVNKPGVLKQKEISFPEIKEVKAFIDLSSHKTVNDRNSSITVTATYKEIDKEEKTLKVEGEGTSKVSQSQTQAKKHFSKWKEGKSKMDIYFQQQKQATARRQRRSAKDQESIPRLTKEERSAFLEMLKLFEFLNEEKQKLTPRLQQIEGVKVTAPVVINKHPRSDEVSKKLKEIGWTTRDDVKYTLERPRSYGRSARPASEARWDNWKDNPYKLFLEQEDDYKRLVQKVKAAEKARDDYLSKSRLKGVLAILGGKDGVQSAYSAKGSYDKKIENSKSDIALKVAAKLFSWMNQNPLTLKD